MNKIGRWDLVAAAVIGGAGAAACAVTGVLDVDQFTWFGKVGFGAILFALVIAVLIDERGEDRGRQ